jgi:hypothetical protein
VKPPEATGDLGDGATGRVVLEQAIRVGEVEYFRRVEPVSLLRLLHNQVDAEELVADDQRSEEVPGLGVRVARAIRR